ncbi:hypothetical protein ACH4YO_06135 [Streptomyces noursei]|uniref:hypothetical protein n=1 Tax=Streptomyces noursei TaxID=1971 RepID=UPI00081D05DE|nr:membrane protein [Streptomyces noursei ATCC 11455]MCZ0993666.1 hypothetical protein [Streptomyces noursei]
MTARRPLLTAAAAGSVLFALWFVPSANALVEDDGATHSGLRTQSAPAAPGQANVSDPSGAERHTGDGSAEKKNSDTRESGIGSTTTRPGGAPAENGGPAHYLADTGSPDTTPYAVGGAACLVLGAALVGYSVHRTRDETA